MPPGAAEIAVFGMLGALMFASKLALSALPNVHLCGVFIVACTVVYRSRALYPIYVFVFLTGLFEGGFNAWWLPYLYIWLPLWAMVMILPKSMPKKLAPVIYMSVCALHGFAFGTLYAPAQALLFGFDLNTTLMWIASGLWFDLIHGVSNFVCGVLIVPIISVLQKINRQMRP